MLAVALRAFVSVDVMATPTVASLRKVIGEDQIHIAGEDMPYARAKGVFTAPVNHLGLPALALPLPGSSVPPPSVQIIGPPWSETRLLGTGLSLEHEGIVSTATPPHWRPGGVDTNQERNA